MSLLKKLVISSLGVSSLLFLGRISGFVRETVIAKYFGASEYSDVIVLMLTTPDLLVNLLVGGALSMALIPELSKYEQEKKVIIYRQLIIIFMLLFGFLTVVLINFSPAVMHFLAPGVKESIVEKFNCSFNIVLSSIVLTVFSGLTTSYLNEKGKFLIPASGTLIFNFVVIVFIIFSNNYITYNVDKITIIAFGIVVAALARWLSQVTNSNISPFGRGVFRENVISRSFINRYFYCLATGGVVFFVPVLMRGMSSYSGEGMFSVMNYSIKLVELPLGVVITVFSIILFPKLSKFKCTDQEEKFDLLFSATLGAVAIISILTCITLVLLSNEIVNVLFGFAGLEQQVIEKIIQLFSILSFSIPFQGINSLLVAAFAARIDTKTPFVITTSLAIVLFSITLIIGPEPHIIAYFAVGFYASVTCMLILVYKFKFGKRILPTMMVMGYFLRIAMTIMYCISLEILKSFEINKFATIVTGLIMFALYIVIYFKFFSGKSASDFAKLEII